MRCKQLSVVALGLGLWACSGSGSDADRNDSGGGASSASSGGSASGGAFVAGGGGRSASAGTAGVAGAAVSSAGAAGSSAGTAGDDSGTSACPVWPRTRLMPLIGPFFYGPDPGPCSDRYASYTFQAGRLQSQVARDTLVTSTYTYDAQGLPSGVTASDGTSASFEFGPDYLLDIERDELGAVRLQVRYTLTSSGYPTTIAIDRPDTPTQIGSYSYENCRLVARMVGVAGSQPLSYEYDSAGHMTARLCGGCFDESSYDYSCWQ